MAEGKGPVKVEIKSGRDVLVGKYVVLYRGDAEKAVAEVGKIIDFWEEEGQGGEIEKRVSFEMVTGPEKGQEWNGRYEENQSVMVYGEDELALALLEV